MMMELHSHGKTIEDIVQVLKRIPINPRIIPSIKAAYALGYLFIYSFIIIISIFVFYEINIIIVFKLKTRGIYR
jgi:hypothetical protein